MTAAAEMPSDDDGQKFIFDVGLVSECLFEVIEEQEKSKDVGKVLGNAITPKDVETLKKSEYLNDSIINAYLQMVAKEKPGEIYVFDTFFHPSLLKGKDMMNFRWVKRTDFFSYKWLLFPVNDANHWSIVVVDFIRRNFHYYDSIEFESTTQEQHYVDKYVSPVSNFIDDLAQSKLGKENYSKDFQWISQNVPVQSNKVDCGMFVCQFVKYFCRGDLLYQFDQTDMFELRNQVAVEIILGTLF